MRDIMASQNFLKNASIYWLERSDLTPILFNKIGGILFIGINKYYHFFLINLAIDIQKIKKKKNNISKYQLSFKNQ
jgi:hypothetical protein